MQKVGKWIGVSIGLAAGLFLVVYAAFTWTYAIYYNIKEIFN